MSKLTANLRTGLLCAAMITAACGDDEEPGPGAALDGSVSLDATLSPATGDGGVSADGATTAPSANPLYLVGTSITSGDESTLYLWSSKQLDGVKLDFKQAMELAGASEAVAYNGYVYIPSSDDFTITRYDVKDDQLIKGPVASFAGLGLQWLSYVQTIASPERAFLVNDGQYKIIEWNPTTMTITKMHDISPLRREGWGQEFRGGFLRSDGKLFLHWTYTNARKDFLNSFVVAVWDTNTAQLTIEEEARCPTSAGFGGYFDEQEDLYLIADSFGLFTQFGGYEDPKPACILRVKKGESKLDPTFLQRPTDALGGHFPWGFYYLGNGLAYTSGIDPAITTKYNSVFEILFAPEHEGWLLDVKANSARKIANLPKDGVGFESFRVDGRLFVPRTTGMVTIENIMSTDSTLFEVKPDATATPILKVAGTIGPLTRAR